MARHGELIRRAREARGWSISELARAAGIDRPMVSRIERAELSGSLVTVAALFAALDMDLNLLKPDSDAGLEGATTECA